MGGMMQMMTAIPNMVNGMRESQARSQLTPIVRYVVGDTATPSPEMVNFAVIAGSAPVTQTEKDAYLDMMKRVARKTPEVLVKFIESKNGTFAVNEQKLDNHITKRAMQYAVASGAKKERKRKEEERARQQELEMLRMRQNHELDLIGILGPNINTMGSGLVGPSHDVGLFGMDPGFGAGIDPFMDIGVMQPVMQPVQQVSTENVASSASTNAGASDSVSLLDILRNHGQNSRESTGSNQGTASVNTAQIMPAGDADMLNMLMLNSGLGMGLAF